MIRVREISDMYEDDEKQIDFEDKIQEFFRKEKLKLNQIQIHYSVIPQVDIKDGKQFSYGSSSVLILWEDEK